MLIVLVSGLTAITAVVLRAPEPRAQGESPKGRTYYVRETVGDDGNDGLSATTAWRSISKLSNALREGDIAYVGPGLYRDHILIQNSGTAQDKLTLIADTTGQHTGDPPGVVMITGADPAVAGMFVPHSVPGVYRAALAGIHLGRPTFSDFLVWGIVELDGAQYRYARVTSMKEYLIDKVAPVDIVAKLPSTYHYDEQAQVLYIHTSDGRAPSAHDIELIRRTGGIVVVNKFFVTVIGFTIRHVGDGGIIFLGGSGGLALNNTVYGSRQGMRVFGRAQNLVMQGNTLFRNENSGVYFMQESTNAVVIGNTLYENIKGIRLASKSVNGVVANNTAFDNHEAGISVEDVEHAVLLGNRLVNNKWQLLVMRAQYRSEGNCFESRGPEQVLVSFHFELLRYKTLAEYQRDKSQDLLSREGGCGPLPEKVDVRKLHRETSAYTERARKLLSGAR